ncbi:hypothetical protein GCM10025869_30930 [Homoserinibacter gongjuensis]|uniref:Uncharacterized protein n=1 Tax=Homoserinibacter gongjuensis TaxID=1162968 RepID=A0ABQ6JX32_9MICO|nr:hypothetical protein GCM10025869_30930 [Homoserinibacter gongjuensis]
MRRRRGIEVRESDETTVWLSFLDARIVDEHIETAELGDAGGRSCDRVVGGDIELNELGTELARGGRAPFRVARPDEDAMPLCDEGSSGLAAETLVRSGDEGCCHESMLERSGPDAQAANILVRRGPGSTAATRG